MPPDLLQSARERAEAEDRSLSATVRVALREYCRDAEQREDAEPGSKAPA
jgi:hypothetical protein